uniref:Uncharacterized protein n=1 Tax=Bionectria ochroleuca TaxID=29856 RepID=A0A0B7K728_BIOOC
MTTMALLDLAQEDLIHEEKEGKTDEHPIHEPYVIANVHERKNNHANGRNGATHSRNHKQGDILDPVQNLASSLVGTPCVVPAFLQRILDAGECPREDEKAGEQQPDAKRGGYVVPAGDGILRQKHLDITRMLSV